MPDSNTPANTPPGNPDGEHIVVLIHGIRTQGSWGEMVAAVLESTGPAKVIPIKYGYFDVFRFLCPVFTRSAPIRKILRELRDIRATHPAAKISVISHSFGTYAIMKALQEREIMLFRLILCGSIIPESFRRADFRSQLGSDDVVNDCGTHDIWPPLAKSITWGYGATGTFGLGTVGVRDRYNKFGHGDYFNKQFVTDFWEPYIHEGRIVPTEWEQTRNTPPLWMSLLAWFPTKYLAVVGVLLAILLIARAANRSGEVSLDLGKEILVGHYLGIPYVGERLFFVNTTKHEQTFSNLRVSLKSPDGSLHPLRFEAIVMANMLKPLLEVVIAEPSQTIWFDYTFFNYSDSFTTLQRNAYDATVNSVFRLDSPDPTLKLLPVELANRAKAQAERQFIWKPGTWTITFTADSSQGSISTDRTFDLLESDVASMLKITEQYESGIGVIGQWRFVALDGAKPVIQKVTNH